MAGLGFNFGKLPSFDDLAGPEAGSEAHLRFVGDRPLTSRCFIATLDRAARDGRLLARHVG
jgi:hypothetical protein